MNHLKVKRWLEKHLWTTREEGPVVKVLVKHLDANGKAGKVEIWSCMIPHEGDSVTLPEDEIPDMLQDLETTCFDDAEGMAAGLQRYQILAYVKHKAHAHTRFTFRMTGDSDDDEDDTGVSEPATQKGLVAQLMRHNEAIMRSNVLTTNQNLAMLQRTVANQYSHIEKLLDDRRENFEIVETLKSEHHERELATRESNSRQDRFDQMAEKANLLLPAVVNRIAGKKLLPETVSPMQDMMKTFAESLSPEQIATIMPTLKPEQQIALMEFMETSQEDKQLPKGGAN